MKQQKLTPEQAQRLKEFAAQYGRGWKQLLMEMWWTGKDANEPDGHLLRQVRNNLGPRRLAQYKEPT